MADRLKLIDVKTTQHRYSNSVVMTFVFKIKGFDRDIRILDFEANEKIKQMLCFEFYVLSSCGWADPNCKTIQKSILFNISKEVIYNGQQKGREIAFVLAKTKKTLDKSRKI